VATTRPPDSRARAERAARLQVLLRRPRSRLAGAASRMPRRLHARCCDDLSWDLVTPCGARAVVQFGPFELRREYAR
jgi:xanthine/CO dehydrogenase XdhC/CoxF family maturation factor